MKNNSLFITATDTGVGKTLVCGLLLEYLLKHNINTGYQKWVSTGDANNPADLAECTKIAKIQPETDTLDVQVPYRFNYPASPHLSAEIDGIEINPEKILDAYSKICEKYKAVIVEGVGGLMVPLRRDLLLADLLERVKIPTVIVSRSGLGTLNHTLLTIEAVRRRNIPVVGVLFTDSTDEEQNIATDNMRTIRETGQVEILGRLPHCSNHNDLVEHFNEIGNKLLPCFSL